MLEAPPFLEVKALHERLAERVGTLRPLIVGDVLRVFLEVSSLPCEQTLWSLEFAFDEDDSRVARFEARFARRGDPIRPSDEQEGYEVSVHLPRVFPARMPAAEGHAKLQAPAEAAAGTLVSRFVRALEELGAYRTLERLEVGSADVDLL